MKSRLRAEEQEPLRSITQAQWCIYRQNRLTEMAHITIFETIGNDMCNTKNKPSRTTISRGVNHSKKNHLHLFWKIKEINKINQKSRKISKKSVKNQQYNQKYRFFWVIYSSYQETHLQIGYVTCAEILCKIEIVMIECKDLREQLSFIDAKELLNWMFSKCYYISLYIANQPLVGTPAAKKTSVLVQPKG